MLNNFIYFCSKFSYRMRLLVPYQLNNKINLCCVSSWMCLLLPYQLKNYINFMLRFFLNVSITPLPAEELHYLYAAFLPECVYYSLTGKELNELYAAVHSWLCQSPARLRSRRRFMLNCISKVLSCVSSPEDRCWISYQICASYFVVKWDDLCWVIFFM